jgi:hypothetical protein
MAVAGVDRGAAQRLAHRWRTSERRDQFAIPIGDLQADDVRAVLATDHVSLVRQGADKVIRRRNSQLAPSGDLLHGESARGTSNRLEHAQGT